MGKKGVAKKRLDKYYHLAKERGYRSRAAFKLVQLNKKFGFLQGARGVLDLCAAPGSWLQVAREYMPVSGVLVGVDLVPIRPVPKAVTLTADITSDSCRAALRKQFKDVRVDCVLHDGAPNVGQAWLKDAYGQAELTLASLKLGAEFLAPGGWFVTKVFRSADYNALLWVFNQLFDRVEATKPQASRAESAEIFVVCSRFTGAKIDPRLFDPRAVFSDLTQLRQANALQAKPGAKAPALGYAEADYTLYHLAPVVAFVRSEAPVRVLSEKSRLVWDGADAAVAFYEEQPSTTLEVKRLCEDLRVLGKGDLRTLLKWRLKMRAAWAARLAAAEGGAPAAAEGGAEEDGCSLDGDEREDAEALVALDSLAASASAREKLALRRAKLRLTKQKERLALKMELPGDALELQDDPELFSLARVRGEGALEAVLGDEAKGGASADIVPDDDDDDGGGGGGAGGARRAAAAAAAAAAADDDDEDDDDEAAYSAQLEAQLDELYEQYRARSRSKAAQQRALAAKFKTGPERERALGGGGAAADSDDDDDDDGGGGGVANPLLKTGAKAGAEEEEEGEEEGDERGHADAWFSLPLMAQVEADRGGGAGGAKRARGGGGGGAAAAAGADSEAEEEEEEEEEEEGGETDGDATEEEEEEEEEDPPPRGKRAKPSPGGAAASARGRAAPAAAERAANGAAREGAAARARAAARAVATGAAEIGGAEEEDGEDDLERVGTVYGGSRHRAQQARVEREAERIALGQMLIRKRSRRDLEDSAYNRNAWADKELPEWFADDERRVRHTAAGLQLADAAALSAAAEGLKAIDARTIGKVAEAKARKKRRTAKVIEKLKKQANAIVGKEDMSEREKATAIEKLYSKGGGKLGKKRPSAKIVVTGRSGRSAVAAAKSGGPKGAGTGRVKRVDKRMLADKRGEKAAAKRQKGGGKGKGGKGSARGKKGGGKRK